MAWLLSPVDNHTLVDNLVFHILHHNLVVAALSLSGMVLLLLVGVLGSHILVDSLVYHIPRHS